MVIMLATVQSIIVMGALNVTVVTKVTQCHTTICYSSGKLFIHGTHEHACIALAQVVAPYIHSHIGHFYVSMRPIGRYLTAVETLSD